jgi:hypothetical protein
MVEEGHLGCVLSSEKNPKMGFGRGDCFSKYLGSKIQEFSCPILCG